MFTRWLAAAFVGEYAMVMPFTEPVGDGVMVLGLPVGEGDDVGESVGDDVGEVGESVGEALVPVGDGDTVSVMVVVGPACELLLEQPASASGTTTATAPRRRGGGGAADGWTRRASGLFVRGSVRPSRPPEPVESRRTAAGDLPAVIVRA
jgi:hypothetical protein